MKSVLFTIFALSNILPSLAVPQPTNFKNLDRLAAAKARAQFEAQKALPFKVVEWKTIPSKDYKESWAFHHHASARALANGTIEKPVKIAKRNVGGIFISTEFDWGSGGLREYKIHPLNDCIRLTGTPWFRTLKSFGPDPGTMCLIFSTGTFHPDPQIGIDFGKYILSVVYCQRCKDLWFELLYDKVGLFQAL
ncbi:hypothetical protein TWF730_009946 [Orbilia blumenaviensis]|uniref:Uncharacterized protein n=1 Tax=Orbilia blumenaviensis TaxID=1796055 RepID=A0AAV9UZV7_9PEZI